MSVLLKPDAWIARNRERMRLAYARFPDLGPFEDRYWACIPNPPDDPRWLGLQIRGHDLPDHVVDYYVQRAAREQGAEDTAE
jgi:hypothetical protein